jgi:hypothetical protein
MTTEEEVFLIEEKNKSFIEGFKLGRSPIKFSDKKPKEGELIILISNIHDVAECCFELENLVNDFYYVNLIQLYDSKGDEFTISTEFHYWILKPVMTKEI